MIRRFRVRFLAWILILGVVPIVFACQYTVRDIGFIELVDHDYRLLLLVSELDDLADSPEAFRRNVLKESLSDWNVDFQVLSKDELRQLPAKLREQMVSSASEWSCWLTDNQARCLLLKEGVSPQVAESDIEAVVRERLDTPMLRHVRDQALKSFAQMIVCEAEPRSGLVEPVIEESRQALAQIAHLLPRPVELPVEVLRVLPKDRDVEKVLLWSLQVELDSPNQPSLAIVYGRGKLAGPVMVGDDIQVDEILSQLALIGESCECETDRGWFQEPSIPLNWTANMRDDAIHHLGFNPASQLVKSEARKILSRGPNSGLAAESTTASGDRIDQILSSYKESGLNVVPNSRAYQDGLENRSEQVKATVISGDGWGFEGSRSGESDSAKDSSQIAMLSIPPGSQSQSTEDSTDSAKNSAADVSGRKTNSANRPNRDMLTIAGILALAIVVPFIIFSLRSQPAKKV